MDADVPMILNRDCYCRPIERQEVIQTILKQKAAPNMEEMLKARLHYFANTNVFLSPDHLSEMLAQIRAIENVVKKPGYIEHIRQRSPETADGFDVQKTKGVFMGYDFHLSEDGPKLIEINSNAGGAFIVNMIERASQTSSGHFSKQIMDMFQSEWTSAGRRGQFKSLAIVDERPTEQYHYPDMCLAKSLLEDHGIKVVITDPENLDLRGGKLFHGELQIDLIYNRLTDFDLSESANQIISRAYKDDLAVITPAPHHHAQFADKRNLITLSDSNLLSSFGVAPQDIESLKSIPKTMAVTDTVSEEMWISRRSLFFKPSAGFGSRGAFRGSKLTKKVWGEILEGGYIAQERVIPPLRAVTVEGERTSLKFDVRVYTYDGTPLLFAARVYQG